MLTLINQNIRKNINFRLKKMKNSGQKKGRELTGLKSIQKLKTLNIVKMKLR